MSRHGFTSAAEGLGAWQASLEVKLSLFDPRNGFKVGDPPLLGASPDLPGRHELIPLGDGADAKTMAFGLCLGGGGINRRPAFRAKRLETFCAAFRGFDIDFQFSRQELKSAFAGGRYPPKRRARQGLTVSAVTERYFVGVNFGLVGNGAAMATSVDLHFFSPVSEPIPRFPSDR